MRRRFTRPIAIAIAIGCTFLQLSTLAAAEPALPEGFQDSIAIDGLQQPTALRFSSDGRVFVAEKSGEIQVYDDIEDTTPNLFADLRTDVYNHGDRGLLGLALDPKFNEGRPYVYALYTYDHILGDPEPAPAWGTPEASGDLCSEPNGGDDCLVSGRLVRLTAEESEGTLRAEEEGGTPLQYELVEDWCQQFSSHSIGDLRFGPEGALYASGGDGASFTGADYGQLGGPVPNPCGDPPGPKGTKLEPPDAEGGSLRAQNLDNLSGSIIRIDPNTGEAFSGNPLEASEGDERIVAYGFRNPFRFTADPATGELYVANVGSSEIEELDRFAAPPTTVYNSGWPCYEGIVHQFLFSALGLEVCESLYATEPGSTSPPFFRYNHKQEVVVGDECDFSHGSALGGIVFYEEGSYPDAYDGALFFSDAVRGCVWAMFPGEDGRPDPESTIRFLSEGQIYPAVDMQVGPDGVLYYVDLFGDEEYGPGAIHRVSYDPGAPKARLTADPRWGPVEPDALEVNFDAGESSDPSGEELTYDWDLDDDGNFEREDAGALQTLEFEEDENVTVAVRVTDGEELTSIARVTVYPGDSPPNLTVAKPFSGLKWAVGDEIEFKGFATDAEGGSLFGSSVSWNMLLAHCPDQCHKHPLASFPEVREGSFTASEHDYPSYIDVNFRATDKRGLSATETVRIDPSTVELAMSSNPSGVSLTAGLVVEPTPFSMTAIEGSSVVISAPPTADIEGAVYKWASWSDEGARIHTVPAGDASYVAQYEAVEDEGEETEGEGGQAPSDGDSLPITPVPAFPSVPDLDTLAPRTTIRRHPRKTSRSRIARFAFVASEPGSQFRCRLDRGRFRPCRSPRVYRRLKPGRHVFRVFAIDSSGNRDRSPAVFRWRVVRRGSHAAKKKRHRIRHRQHRRRAGR